jgi:lipopolysaccharide transport system ATP-binding protein
MSPVIQISNLSKIYRLGEIGTGTISRDLERWYKMKIRGQADPFLKIGETNDRSKKGASDVVYALRDINFEVQQGEALGIIGKNGAGKSTLLKIISRVTGPTTGRINIKGRVASLLEVGTGFHPELTGRENIYLNGAILGMRKKEIARKLDEIIDFSGVERYIDTPVKRYSSGMYVRLAFAVAAHLESEILIVDEVLAVGDAEFQKKCLGKMGKVSTEEGRTVLFVSHNMAAIENLCNRGMLLTDGLVHSIAESKMIISNYLSLNSSLNQTNDLSLNKERRGNGILKFTRIVLIDDDTGDEVSEIKCGSNIRFRIFLERTKPVLNDILLAIGINDQYEQRISFLSNDMLNQTLELQEGNKDYIDVIVYKIPFTPGRYNLTLFCAIKGEIADWIQNAYYFDICSGDFYNTGREVKEGNGCFLLNYQYK